MQAIDNTNLLQLCRDCGLPGFVPGITYVYDAALETITLTSTTVLPTGHTFKRIHVSAHSVRTGDEVRGNITTVGGNVVLNVASLDPSKGFNLTATITTVENAAADGSAFDIKAGGALGAWDVQSNA